MIEEIPIALMAIAERATEDTEIAFLIDTTTMTTVALPTMTITIVTTRDDHRTTTTTVTDGKITVAAAEADQVSAAGTMIDIRHQMVQYESGLFVHHTIHTIGSRLFEDPSGTARGTGR
jgi:hypothetical protein